MIAVRLETPNKIRDLQRGLDWVFDHAFLLVPAQQIVGKFLATFKDYPPRQKAASFTVDQVLEKLQEGIGSH